MADLVIKRHDTYPYLRGQAKDEEGLLDLSEADKVKVILKSGETVIEGTVEVLEGDPEEMNWQYKWKAGDTSISGTYSVELEITWDEGSSPPKVETVPNGGYATVEIKDDLS